MFADRLSYFQSKHPHIIYESIEKPRQQCAVLDNQLRNSGSNSRQKREVDSDHHHHLHLHHHHHQHLHDNEDAGEENVISSEYEAASKPSSARHVSHVYNVTRVRRDVRYVPKFVETALVLDKAMVRSRAKLNI